MKLERYEWAKAVRRKIRDEWTSFDAFASSVHYSSGYINNVLSGLRSDRAEAIISERLELEMPERG